ncbi:secondary thiamine-phosphate synthase enzyme [Kribbella antiqua]|uniref:Secondary thiamine-phosphate synthase enzyme n=1 Tax=Kribbella antiqua TaxID=2512217 RepID=A0A4R2IGV3_9ACTN|nr:secondary thiamine-phosphate synthase enzyme YjbQ [Kribbella antiqua]TCO44014.1 secondary thiamine-phosphate synthase enzyme [Kribbella antiqua]
MPGTWTSFPVNTSPKEGYANPVHYVDVTPQLRDAARGDHGDGVLHIFLPHTTATLIFNSGVDGTTLQDIRIFIEEQVPTDRPFVHLHDGPQDAAAHVRCVFGVQSLQLPVVGGELGIGHSQGVYLLELDGPRDRTVQYALQTF